MKLHEQVKTYKEIKIGYEDGLDDLVRYLNLPKFGNDVMVNKNDILLRIQEIKNDIQFFEDSFK
jgi:hypothetical protein